MSAERPALLTILCVAATGLCLGCVTTKQARVVPVLPPQPTEVQRQQVEQLHEIDSLLDTRVGRPPPVECPQDATDHVALEKQVAELIQDMRTEAGERVTEEFRQPPAPLPPPPAPHPTKPLATPESPLSTIQSPASQLLAQLLNALRRPPQKILVRTEIEPTSPEATLYFVPFDKKDEPIGNWQLYEKGSSLHIGKYWYQPRVASRPGVVFQRQLVHVLNDPTSLSIPLFPEECMACTGAP